MSDKWRMNFIKFMVIWVFVVMTLCIAASITLAAYDKDPVTIITVTMISSFGVTIFSYCWKSSKEKESRYEHGLDENGIPFNLGEGEEHKNDTDL